MKPGPRSASRRSLQTSRSPCWSPPGKLDFRSLLRSIQAKGSPPIQRVREHEPVNRPAPFRGLTRRAFALSSLSALATATLPMRALAQLTGERVQDGVYTIAVFGDSMAEGLWTALYRKLQRDPRFEVLRRSRPVVGLARPDYYDWESELANFLRADPIDAAIFSIGLNDMQGMVVPGGNPHQFRSEAWSAEYRARVTRLVRQLKAENVPTFWIGLPIMRSQQYSGNIAHLNG